MTPENVRDRDDVRFDTDPDPEIPGCRFIFEEGAI